MVAYNFKSAFHGDIQAYLKRQTIRANRKRHARVGEPMQVYAGLRTKHARKLIPDPTCTRVRMIIIAVGKDRRSVDYVELDGIRLSEPELHALARADGFKSLDHFACFWGMTHGAGLFEGVLIEWSPA